MKGKVEVLVQNERIKYEFVIRRNITIIRGDSATGKTSLIDMISEYRRLGKDSGVTISCAKKCAVIDGNEWENQLCHITDSLVFVDEGNQFVSTVEFARYIQKTDNYYILVTREDIETLPYSVDEIYGIRFGGKYGGLSPLYHEMYRIYTDVGYGAKPAPVTIITEDASAGYQFFEKISNDRGIACISAEGKSNICEELLKHRDEMVTIIADGAAFGSEMDKVSRIIKTWNNITLYLPESFEWLILMSDVLNDKEIRTMSEHWEDYIESRDYFSWERFFTNLLIQKSKDTYLKYSKKNLSDAYLTPAIQDKIIKQIPWLK